MRHEGSMTMREARTFMHTVSSVQLYCSIRKACMGIAVVITQHHCGPDVAQFGM